VNILHVYGKQKSQSPSKKERSCAERPVAPLGAGGTAGLGGAGGDRLRTPGRKGDGEDEVNEFTVGLDNAGVVEEGCDPFIENGGDDIWAIGLSIMFVVFRD